MAEKNVTLTIAGEDFNFKVTSAGYNEMIDNMQPKSKVVPSHNFVMRCFAEKENAEKLEKLKAVCETRAVELAGILAQELTPEIEITVKK